MQTKRCSKCKIIKPFSEFYKQKGCKDGYCSYGATMVKMVGKLTISYQSACGVSVPMMIENLSNVGHCATYSLYGLKII